MATNIKLKEIKYPFWRTLGIGILAGMRTSAAPVIASHILSHHHSKRLERSPLDFMQSAKAANIFKYLSIGELIVDKMPSTPNRTKPAGIAFRCLAGALAGAGIYKATGGSVFTGMLIGATSATVSTCLSFMLRKSIVKSTGIIDPLIGAIEDALVIGVGVGLAGINPR